MPKSIQGAQSFARNLTVLQLIADAREALDRSELQEQCGLTRPTLYRVIAALEAEGLIEITQDKRFKLGGRLVSLARQALAQNDVRKVAEQLLVDLRDLTGETVHLAIASGDRLVYIDKIESMQTVRMGSAIGTRVCYHSSGVGKAFLSALSESESDRLIEEMDLLEITSHTKTSVAAVKEAVDTARTDGFVCDSQENEVGIVCFGAAVLESAERPVASVSVSVPLFRLDEDHSRYTGPLLQAVSNISARLGCHP